MTEDSKLYGYEATDEIEIGGRYLSFRKGDKGRVIQVRLVSQPKYVNQHWILTNEGKQSPVNCKGDECPYCGLKVPPAEKVDKTAKWGWVVIDRADENVKIFTGPTLIARKIRALVENAKWGNPFLYDIEIKRDEEPGAGYYSVTPVPDGKGQEITAEEKKKVNEAKFDLASELRGGRDSKHLGSYSETPVEMETALDESGEAKEVVETAPKEDLPF
jgi:hypothetical protein